MPLHTPSSTVNTTSTYGQMGANLVQGQASNAALDASNNMAGGSSIGGAEGQMTDALNQYTQITNFQNQIELKKGIQEAKTSTLKSLYEGFKVS